MTGNELLLDVKGLRTSFSTFLGEVEAVRNVSFSVKPGEIVGIVGESGSGKTVSALSVSKLLPDNGMIKEGSVNFNGMDILSLSEKEMRRVRNSQISMIFQDPMTSLNPTIRVGKQITERLRAFQKKLSEREARKRAVELLEMVRIPDAAQRIQAYPFEMSGGMRQRVMIAIAIACNPKLLIADEPTTALDVTIQNQILKLLRALKDNIGSSIILITHDLGVVAETCERVVVMYGGMVMEEGTVEEIFYHTSHPYTMGLKRSIPDVTKTDEERLFSIEGSPPQLIDPPQGCPFADRCQFAMGVCKKYIPDYYSLSETHRSMCWLLDPGCPNKIWKEEM